MFGMSVLGTMPLGALPILLSKTLRVRRSPSYITVLQDITTLYQSSTTSTGNLFDSTTGGTDPIFQETINDG